MAEVAALWPGIDKGWLDRAARDDPLGHALALWDVEHEPVRARFVSWGTSRATLAYLLLWMGDPTRPMVHWRGAGRGAEPLLAALPRPPYDAVVPREVAPLVLARLGSGSMRPILGEIADRPDPPPPRDPRVARAGAHEAEEIHRWARSQPDPIVGGYTTIDPVRQPTWIARERGTIVGAATSHVQLPRLWLINGIYVAPEQRGRQLGGALTAAVMEAAREHGAVPALYVREENAAAVRLYQRLGFRPVGSLTLVEAERPSA